MQKSLISKKINKNKFNLLLDWLSDDRLESADKYREIHRKLIMFFSARGCAAAEDLADLTIDRVTHKIYSENIKYEGNQIKYFFGFAKNIYQEHLRDRNFQLNEEILKDDSNPEHDKNEDEISATLKCLKKCLVKLPGKDKKLMLEYYGVKSGREKDFREKIAKKYSLSTNSLRVKVFRLKKNLENCVENCLNF